MSVSKRQTTTYNHFQICKKALHDIYQRMHHFQESLDWLIAERKKWREIPSQSKLTSYYHGVLSGIDDCLYNEVRGRLTWVFLWNDENGIQQVTQGWENMPENIRMDSTKFVGVHVWMRHPEYVKYPEVSLPLKHFNTENKS